MSAERHVTERLDEWIDGRLSADDALEVERHLDECGSCRAQADALREVRATVASYGDDFQLPPGLEGRIRGLLDAEDEIARERTRTAAEPARPSRPLAVWSLPLAAALVLAVVGLLWWTMRTATPFEPVGEAFAQFEELTGARETWRDARVDGARELEQRWRTADLGFPARVLDLSMSGYTLAGGRATRLAGRPAALAIYRGPGGLVTCWMFDGDNLEEERFPEAVDVHEANGIRFHVFEREGATLVVWREGEVLCALSGRMSRGEVVALAHEKAMAPARQFAMAAAGTRLDLDSELEAASTEELQRVYEEDG